MIGAPGHSKDIMDVMNTFHNRYLKGKMCMVGTSAVDYSTKIMEDYAMVGETKSNWAITYKKLLHDNIRVHGVNLTRNTAKERRNRRLTKGHIIYKIWTIYT